MSGSDVADGSDGSVLQLAQAQGLLRLMSQMLMTEVMPLLGECPEAMTEASRALYHLAEAADLLGEVLNGT